MTGDPTDDLLEQLGRGEVEALGELFAAYAPYLRAVVRRQLSDRLRAKFDSADVVQSVWVQVLQQLGKDGLKVADENHLRALLATVARRRLITRARKHDRGADQPPGDEWTVVADPHPARPSQVAQAADLWDRMLDLLPPEHHEILHLKREGLPLADIAARTGLHEGSVRRILRKLSRELALRDVPLPETADAEPG
jgi:RNA polymerase sigma-70 factor (ECF subfamily)